MPPRWREPWSPALVCPWVWSQRLFLNPTPTHRLMPPSPSGLRVCPEPLPDDSSGSLSHLSTACQLCLALGDPEHCGPATSSFSPLGSEGQLFLTSWIHLPLLQKQLPTSFGKLSPHSVLVKLAKIFVHTSNPLGRMHDPG